MAQKEIEEVYYRLVALYEDPKTELIYKNSWELLIAVILSAQCTDARVNQTTPALFAKYPDAKALGNAKQKDVEKLIHSCGFYRQKAISIINTSRDLVEKFNGQIPNTLEELITLRGVGRKTASVVLNQAFGLPAIAVDTHVFRVSRRLGWAKGKNAEKVELELMALLPKPLWATINGLLILHGRRICKARKPLCDQCPVNRWCLYFNSGAAELD